MAFGMHKPGQGYWVRVMTATMIGVATLAASAWVWSQMSVVAAGLPHVRWAMSLGELSGDLPVAGTTVALSASAPRGQTTGTSLGTAVVESYTPASQTLRLRTFTPAAPGFDPTQSALVEIPGAGTPEKPAFKAVVRDSSASAIVQPVLLQGIAASVMLLIGSIVAYWVCAIKPATVEFLVATDMEMKKVNWSTRRDILAQTWVVIGAAVLIAGALFGVDVLFQTFFQQIGILVH